jgi:hypothetical protein
VTALQEVPVQAAIAWRWQYRTTEYEICWPLGASTLVFAYRPTGGRYWTNARILRGAKWRVTSRTKAEAMLIAERFAAGE